MASLPTLGRVLGKYELVRRLAAGGMAQIYLARASGIEGFQRWVVIKKILPQYAADPAWVAMFLDEARLAATLHHSNVTQVFDIGMDGGDYFFAMEFVHGEDARAILQACSDRGEPLGLANAVAIVMGAAAGLHYAHERCDDAGRSLGLVHRDVSPSNLMVTFDGVVKIADFGIAKAALRTSETRTGAVKGKVRYMSPEQCRGKPLDRRSDIFALGIVLYELTTVSKLFTGDNDYHVMERIVHGQIEPPSRRVVDYPRALEQVVMRCLAREPSERYLTAERLMVDLDRVAREGQMATSQVMLTMLMRRLFGQRLEPWREMAAAAAELAVAGTAELSRPEASEAPAGSRVTSVPPPVEPRALTAPTARERPDGGGDAPAQTSISDITTLPPILPAPGATVTFGPPGLTGAQPLAADAFPAGGYRPSQGITVPVIRDSPSSVTSVAVEMGGARAPSARRWRGFLIAVGLLAVAGGVFALVANTGGSSDREGSAPPSTSASTSPPAPSASASAPSPSPHASAAAGAPAAAADAGAPVASQAPLVGKPGKGPQPAGRRSPRRRGELPPAATDGLPDPRCAAWDPESPTPPPKGCR